MKLCRYGPGGHEKPGIIDSNGKLRDLSLIIDEIGPGRLEPRKLRALAAAVKVEALPLVEGHPRFAFSWSHLVYYKEGSNGSSTLEDRQLVRESVELCR